MFPYYKDFMQGLHPSNQIGYISKSDQFFSYNEAPREPLWAAGHQTDKTGRSLDPAVVKTLSGLMTLSGISRFYAT